MYVCKQVYLRPVYPCPGLDVYLHDKLWIQDSRLLYYYLIGEIKMSFLNDE